ncbi:type II toxin-antitoxin system RelE/ParE family toxin [Sodalis sp. RH16]|uniref:type II toxin-antitoxin system RelE/ParE family toxin n=1 Tax=Sodalis sp. RH16 TaxID=3394331 RepID=UPI0039B6A4B4
MTAVVQWAKQAQADREAIYVYLYREAGMVIADSVDEKFIAMATLLEKTPLCGVQTGNKSSRRKLVMPRLPFIMVYAIEAHKVRILRILHTSRKITSRYQQL